MNDLIKNCRVEGTVSIEGKNIYGTAVLHQLDQKIIYPHYDFKHLTKKYFEIGMKLNDFSIQLVKY
jgi:ABC-type phosphate transport system ATPase subunit